MARTGNKYWITWDGRMWRPYEPTDVAIAGVVSQSFGGYGSLDPKIVIVTDPQSQVHVMMMHERWRRELIRIKLNHVSAIA